MGKKIKESFRILYNIIFSTSNLQNQNCSLLKKLNSDNCPTPVALRMHVLVKWLSIELLVERV